MTSDSSFDLHAAAERAGVHYQTAYRWVRSGQLRASVVNARYSIATADLDAFLEQRHAPTVQSVPSAKRLSSAALTMHDAMTEGDEATARKLAHQLVTEGTPVHELIHAVLSPPLRQIGQDWHDGLVSVWVEHRASAITERILGDIAPNPRGRRRGTVMVAAVEGDRHALATSMAAVTLRDANWHVHHLGADLPVADVVDFVATHDVDVAVLTLSIPEVRDTAESAAEQLEALGIAAIIGGPGRTLDDLLDEVSAAAARIRTQRTSS